MEIKSLGNSLGPMVFLIRYWLELYHQQEMNKTLKAEIQINCPKFRKYCSVKRNLQMANWQTWLLGRQVARPSHVFSCRL